MREEKKAPSSTPAPPSTTAPPSRPPHCRALRSLHSIVTAFLIASSAAGSLLAAAASAGGAGAAGYGERHITHNTHTHKHTHRHTTHTHTHDEDKQTLVQRRRRRRRRRKAPTLHLQAAEQLQGTAGRGLLRPARALEVLLHQQLQHKLVRPEPLPRDGASGRSGARGVLQALAACTRRLGCRDACAS
jgi:Ni/Co efflux regulator RcnB